MAPTAPLLTSMICKIVFVSAGVCLLTLYPSCIEVPKYSTLEPVSPRPVITSARNPVYVDSLTPSFSWKGGSPSGYYDFCIWEVQADGGIGESVVQKTQIIGTSFKLETPLAPDHEYYWSVKPSDSSVWATITFTGISPLGVNWGSGIPFKIKTPPRKG